MYAGKLKEQLRSELDDIRSTGLYKAERVIETPQATRIGVGSENPVLNFCANNYLGLANHPKVVEAARVALDKWGYGLSSVRFICGTQRIHKQLEEKLTNFLGTEDTILYTSCFDANGGLFETLLGPEDAALSDELNHASIIDGIRLCKAKRLRYRNNDMVDLEEKLLETKDDRRKLIVTDGVFSMDGTLADLPSICDLAEKHDALVMVDDSHAVGFMGERGRGTHEHQGVLGRIDLITGTLGKALGGASGGYTSGRAEIIEYLRQRSRPYLFSNSVAPPIVTASIAALDLLEESTDLRDRLERNVRHFRQRMTESGFAIIEGEHAIVPIMLGDAALASRFADAMLGKGVYVIGFSYPVVPQGKARIRVQVSAAHTLEDLDFAVEKFRDAKVELID